MGLPVVLQCQSGHSAFITPCPTNLWGQVAILHPWEFAMVGGAACEVRVLASQGLQHRGLRTKAFQFASDNAAVTPVWC